MKVSVIVSVYKDVTALQYVLEGLRLQTHDQFEVVITEDGEDPQMRAFVESVDNLKVVHVTQPDLGWRKTRALNNAVRASGGDYLIFIDGDCVPHRRFVEAHVRLAEPRHVVSGRRVLLGPRATARLKTGRMGIAALQRRFLFYLPWLMLDRGTRLEEAACLMDKGPLSRFAGGTVRDVLGCNFACFKSDLEEINGFDEDYTEPTAGEDCDIAWRFRKIGVTLKSARHLAVQYHLWHGRSHYNQACLSGAQMRSKIQAGLASCRNGLVKF